MGARWLSPGKGRRRDFESERRDRLSQDASRCGPAPEAAGFRGRAAPLVSSNSVRCDLVMGAV
jgi:hypothetical protein